MAIDDLEEVDAADRGLERFQPEGPEDVGDLVGDALEVARHVRGLAADARAELGLLRRDSRRRLA